MKKIETYTEKVYNLYKEIKGIEGKVDTIVGLNNIGGVPLAALGAGIMFPGLTGTLDEEIRMQKLIWENCMRYIKEERKYKK